MRNIRRKHQRHQPDGLCNPGIQCKENKSDPYSIVLPVDLDEVRMTTSWCPCALIVSWSTVVHESQLGHGSCPAQGKRFLIKKKKMFAFLFVRELKLKCESHFDLYFTLMTTQMTIDWTKLFSVDRYMYTVVHLAKNAKLRPTSMLIVRWKDLSKSRWSRRISWQPCCQMKGF